MDSGCKLHRSLLGNEAQAQLLLCLLTGTLVHLAGSPVPRQLLFERKRTPGSPGLDLLCPQPQQQQIGHKGYRHRPFHPRRLLGHLVLAQADDALQFFNTELHRPSSEIQCHGQVSGGVWQIGHEQFGMLGALVAPPSTQHDRDISDLPQLSPLGKRPEDPTSRAGHDQGDADLAVMVDGQMSNQIAQVLAVGQLPGAREGHDKEPPPGLNGLQIGPRRIGGIRHDHDFFTPRGQNDVLEHGPKQGVLGLIARAAFGFDEAKSQRNTVDIPLGDQQDDLQATGERRVLVQPPFLRPGVLLAALGLQGTVHHQIEHPIFGGWKGRQRFADQPLYHPRPRPAPGSQQPAQMPGCHMLGRIPRQSLHGRFPKTHQMGDQQPTQHQVMAIAERGLERNEQTRYFLRHPGHPDHGWPPQRTGLMSLKHPSAYLPGGHPTRAWLLRRSPGKAMKRQHYQATTPFNLSSLSNLILLPPVGERQREGAGWRSISLLFLIFLLLSSLSYAQDTSRRSPVVIATEKASPAVVSILAAQIVERGANPFGGDPLFDDFFRDFLEPFQRRQTEQSLGSGVVIRPDGYVLTNEHVVVQAEKIQVQLADVRKLNARLVGADSDSDLAVLKVEDGKSLPYLPLGSSDDLMIGETVIAIGNPFGLSHTITTGVVSALNRSLNTDGRTYYDFIQTDASINPGNSGGPLLNIKGELIGINSAIYGKAQGIGFAIPISRAKRIVQELITHGAVETPWVGLVVQTLTPELAYHFSLREKEGVLVRGVELESPAAKAGLQRGDVLLGLNGRPLRSAEEYWQRERECSSGDTLRLRVRRARGEEEVAVTAARFPQEKADALAWQLLGVSVVEEAGGVEVKKVRQGSPAARIGVERGDAILGLSGAQTKTLAEFRRKIIDARLSQSLLVSIGRGQQLYNVTIPLDQG